SVLEVVDRFRPALLVLGVDNQGIELALDREDRMFEIHSALGHAGAIHFAPSRTVITLVSEDLATHPDLAARVLQVAEGMDPRLVVEGVAAPCIRCLVSEETAGVALAALHDRLFSDDLRGPGEVVE
ncbi:MAG TPA: hypothetical protein VGK45_05275, partial [Thermoanaerobaculia bacterium]